MIVGKKVTGQQVVDILTDDERMEITIRELCGQVGNHAIILNKVLYVSKEAKMLIDDPDCSFEAFKGLIISL